MKRSALASAVMAAFPLAMSQYVHAQAAPAPETPETIEQIVVQGSFLASGSQSAMKLDVPVRDTPFSVSSYTDSFMKAIETASVADMYNYMTGVKSAGITAYDLSLRGFRTSANDRNAILVDGLPGLSVRFGSPPTIGTERIELVKGPMSVLYGQAQPGGFINIITKKPKAQPSTEVDVRGSTYTGGGVGFGDANGYDISADTTGPIDKNGMLLYRLVGQYADKDGYRFATHGKSSYIAPSFTANIGSSTDATVLYEHRESDGTYDTFLAPPNRDIDRIAGIRTRYQEPDDSSKEKGDSLSFSLNHAFAEGIDFNLATRSVRNQDDVRGYDPLAFRPNFQSIQRRARQQHNERHYDFGDTSLKLVFPTAFVQHRVLVGLNGGREIQDFDRRQFFNGGACPGPQCLDIDVYNPVYGLAPALDTLPAVNANAVGNLTHRYTTSISFGAYASDLMTLSEQWKLTLGVRRADEKQKITELRVANAPTQYKESSKVLPLVGAIFQPTQHLSFYASYATSYVPAPASVQDVNAKNPFVPESAKQYEVGVKGERLFGGKTNATLAIFKIEKENTLNTFACPAGSAASGTCAQQIGAEESKGVEVEINARVIAGWQITAGYAFTDAKIKKSRDPVQVDARLTNTARNSLNVWSRYDFQGAMQGLGAGLGLVYTGERTGTLPTTADRRIMRLPAYTTVDLGVYYNFSRYALTFKVSNLLDKRYYQSSGVTADFQVLPGDPRSVALSMRMHF